MRTSVLNIVMLLTAGAIMAQTAPPVVPKPVAKPSATAPAAKPAASTMAKPSSPAVKPTAAKPGMKAVPAKSAVTAKKARVAAPAKPAPKKHVSAPVAQTAMVHTHAKPAPTRLAEAADSSTKTVVKGGRRDPFMNPVKVQQDKVSGSALCTTGGPQCLVIDQITLMGVVKTQAGMIAMIENKAKKQYNLHENDSLMDGKVMKITRDSIVFRESRMDNLGRPSTREVVKKVTVPVV